MHTHERDASTLVPSAHRMERLEKITAVLHIKTIIHMCNEEGYLEELGTLGIKEPTQYSNVFKKAGAHLVEGSIDDKLEDTAEVHDDFDEMVSFQAWLCKCNKCGLKMVASAHLIKELCKLPSYLNMV